MSFKYKKLTNMDNIYQKNWVFLKTRVKLTIIVFFFGNKNKRLTT